MSYTEYTPAAFEAASLALGNQEPVYMINLVRYRAEADYGGKAELPACTGREAYFQRYAPAFNQVAAGEDYSVFWVGSVRGVLVGTHNEAWDDIVIVRYSSFAALRRILENPAYEKNAVPHRRAALADWKFIVTTHPELPK
ncbi:hypothetical protein [Paraburkholderia silvatlantica]|uniref:Uncharacterized protein (DUF1330 family) n=1 Tax=Paraburkholderia silvatlantica TaxID=321895 RepID=A0ABR6FNP5_9BURK|nr:hypothetical protein [Paraburkholderia silvatlantica]MBB2929006.1 uncharacterized protein (DUF1330 family) [Paraburkholderia silvatlantica]PVY29103.1 hypothetical protein C7411_11522 [Paraburkholderia silvatlantica]PXW36578.1 hypothetical protein C7413_11422 [Paraburkholderia silvatlantica]TDQ98966.1 hypothetical protein C7412_104183 [Paraburkholderia silvatlantica]